MNDRTLRSEWCGWRLGTVCFFSGLFARDVRQHLDSGMWSNQLHLYSGVFQRYVLGRCYFLGILCSDCRAFVVCRFLFVSGQGALGTLREAVQHLADQGREV
jgi:hypothetical protein